jgi:hypothetical protein
MMREALAKLGVGYGTVRMRLAAGERKTSTYQAESGRDPIDHSRIIGTKGTYQ